MLLEYPVADPFVSNLRTLVRSPFLFLKKITFPITVSKIQMTKSEITFTRRNLLFLQDARIQNLNNTTLQDFLAIDQTNVYR